MLMDFSEQETVNGKLCQCAANRKLLEINHNFAKLSTVTMLYI